MLASERQSVASLPAPSGLPCFQNEARREKIRTCNINHTVALLTACGGDGPHTSSHESEREEDLSLHQAEGRAAPGLITDAPFLRERVDPIDSRCDSIRVLTVNFPPALKAFLARTSRNFAVFVVSYFVRPAADLYSKDQVSCSPAPLQCLRAQVLPAFSPRLAVTLWFYGRQLGLPCKPSPLSVSPFKAASLASQSPEPAKKLDAGDDTRDRVRPLPAPTGGSGGHADEVEHLKHGVSCIRLGRDVRGAGGGEAEKLDMFATLTLPGNAGRVLYRRSHASFRRGSQHNIIQPTHRCAPATTPPDPPLVCRFLHRPSGFGVRERC